MVAGYNMQKISLAVKILRAIMQSFVLHLDFNFDSPKGTC